MLKATWSKHRLEFKRPSGTSRGILRHKNSWFIKVWDDSNPSIYGIGECGLLAGLSCDDRPDYESIVNNVANDPTVSPPELADWPSIRFGLEMALLDLKNG